MKTDLLETYCKKIVRPQYQLIALLCTFAVVIFLGYKVTQTYHPLEQWPDIKPIIPEKIKEWGGDPVVVDVGLYVTNWYLFEIVDNNFIVDAVVWFQFDPALISIDTIDKFSFESGEIQSKSPPSTKLIEQKLFVEYKLRLRFTSTLNQQFFPLDDHRIFITMVNTYVTPSEVIFQAFKSDFTVAKKVIIPGWTQIGHGVKTGYEEEYIDKFDHRKVIRYPKAVFMLDFSRSGISLISLILLPLFLIFFISTFWFGFKPDDSGNIMALATGGLTSVIAYRFIIQGMSPKVGYFLLSDHIFTFFVAISFASFVLALVWMRQGRMTPMMIKFRGIMFIMFHILFIVTWYFLLFIWIRV